MTYVQRVADKATELEPARALLTVLATPFYFVGWLLGALWLVLSWVWAASVTGFNDARDRSS